jgi:hypothetical protein
LLRARRARWRIFDGRLLFNAIRDDGFTSEKPFFYRDANHFFNNMCIWAEHLRLDHQRGQARELVLWCEAVGMVPQLAAIADDYGIPVFSSGGFDSVTAKYDLAVEWRHAGPITMLHIGDQDPSGVINFEALAGDLIRRRGEDPRLLRSAPAARQNHHASPGRQSSGIPRGRAACPVGRGDEPLPRRQ